MLPSGRHVAEQKVVHLAWCWLSTAHRRTGTMMSRLVFEVAYPVVFHKADVMSTGVDT